MNADIQREVTRYLDKTHHALEVAEVLAKNNYGTDVASEIYYAMFYVTKALLLTIDIRVVKHSAVEAALGYYFVKTGKLDKKFHRIFIDARRIREKVDYEVFETIEVSASLTIEQGRVFIEEIKRLIEQPITDHHISP